MPVSNPDKTELSDLVDYARERQIIIDNTKALLEGKPAANILLTGDAGTGKSSTVKAVVNALWREGLRIIEVRKDQLQSIPKILDELSANPLKFILFIDDLSFLKDDDNFNALKAVLEGSVTAKSQNVAIYATSEPSSYHQGEFSTVRAMISPQRYDAGACIAFRALRHPRDVQQAEQGHVPAHRAPPCGGKRHRYATQELELLAERFALERGNRSARLARQFIDGLLSKAE